MKKQRTLDDKLDQAPNSLSTSFIYEEVIQNGRDSNFTYIWFEGDKSKKLKDKRLAPLARG